MKSAVKYRKYLGRPVWLLLLFFSIRLLATPGQMTMGDTEQKFPLLQTKTGTYTNVTVTKRTKDWIFILHSQGVCNIKASDLSTDARIALGYEAAPDPKKAAAAAAHEPFAKLAKLKLAEVKKFASDWRYNGKEKIAEAKSFFASNPQATTIALGILGAVYIFVSICFWSICRKTHIAPGPLVWVPFLQLIPLLRAANMPRVWFFIYFIPVFNIIGLIVWSIKIVKSRGKSPWVAFLLILPPTSFLAFLYLAMSRSAPIKLASHEVLSLEVA